MTYPNNPQIDSDEHRSKIVKYKSVVVTRRGGPEVLQLAVFFPLWYLECTKEEQEMIERYGDEYIDYRQETGMLLPKVI